MDCRKIKYLTQRAADSMVRWMLERKVDGIKRAERARLLSYRCPRCGFWHVGRRRATKDA